MGVHDRQGRQSMRLIPKGKVRGRKHVRGVQTKSMHLVSESLAPSTSRVLDTAKRPSARGGLSQSLCCQLRQETSKVATSVNFARSP
jgi:hypothetical protein